MKRTIVSDTFSTPSSRPETGYSTMSNLIATWNIPEAQGYYSDYLSDEEEQGANLALAEYILSNYGKGVKFVSALLDNTVRAERSVRDDECDVQVFYAEGFDEKNTPDDEENGLANITAQIVLQLDNILEQMEAFEGFRISILKKVEKALEEFIDAENPEKALLPVYAACVEKIEKIARELYVTPGTYLKYPVCLKKCVRAGRMLVIADPKCERYGKFLAYYLNLQGDRRNGRAAGKCYLEALRQLEVLESMGNEAIELLSKISVVQEKLGDAFAASEPCTAREWYLNCVETEVRIRTIEKHSHNNKNGISEYSIRHVLALKGKSDVSFFEKILAVADKAGNCVPDDAALQLMTNMIVAELLITTGYEKTESSRKWYEMEVKALERVVAVEQNIPRNFWLLSDSYRGLAEHYAAVSPEQALAFYDKCLDNRETVIEQDGERLCYSCGMRPMLLDINTLVEKHAPELREPWYKRWLAITQSCRSLCDNEQITEHQRDIRNVKDKLAKLKQ